MRGATGFRSPRHQPVVAALAAAAVLAWVQRARAALATEAAPAAGLVLAGIGLLVLAPETLRRRRALLAWAAITSGALLGSFAFSRLDPAWHVRWSWDRILVVPLAVLIPVLAEALAECVSDRSGAAPSPASPAESLPPDLPANSAPGR